MGFLVANFLSEQARMQRSHRLSNLRSDANALYAAAAINSGGNTAPPPAPAQAPSTASAAAGAAATAATTAGSTALTNAEGAASSGSVAGAGLGRTEGTAETAAAAAAVDGHTGSEAGNTPSSRQEEGAASSPSAPTRGAVKRSAHGAGASLDSPALVLSCIRRAEALLPGEVATEGGSSAGGSEIAPTGLAGVLHVLLLLATGITVTQRGALVTTGFHIKVLFCPSVPVAPRAWVGHV